MDIGRTLKSYRKAMGLTQTQISAVLGIDRTTYSCYEQNRNCPSLVSLLTLSRVFGVTVDDILVDAGCSDDLNDPDAPESQGIISVSRLSDLGDDEIALILRLRAENKKHLQQFLDILKDT